MARESARSKDTAKPGIKEVAAVAGVSPTTVSRVLNNRGYISQETRDKVHAAMKRINYTPNDIARAMLNGRLNLIGMIVPYVSSPFHAQVVQVIEHTLAENGFKMLLCNSAIDPSLSALISTCFDAIWLMASSSTRLISVPRRMPRWA